MQVKSVEKLTNEKWLNLYAATYEHNGHTGRWLYASRKEHSHEGERVRSDAVIIVPVLRNPGEPPRLVLIKEFRIPAGGIVSGLPAGLLEPGEPIEQTVRRELREETGLEVVAIKRITPPLLSSSGMSDEAAALAFVDARGATESKPALGDSEDIEVVLLDYEQVCRMCDQPDGWMDAKLWTVLYLYRQLGRLE